MSNTILHEDEGGEEEEEEEEKCKRETPNTSANTTTATNTTSKSENNVDNQKKKRQSFTVEEKVKHVAEFVDYYQLQIKKQRQEYEQLIKNNDTTAEELKWNSKTMAKMNPSNLILPWLKNRNDAIIENGSDEKKIAKTTFARWYGTYGNQIEIGGVQSIIGKDTGDKKVAKHKKKLKPRQYHEMESILIDIIRVRDKRLRSQGKPLTSQAFIQQKAGQLFADLYGEEALIKSDFKCSAGWVRRFIGHYELNPPRQDTETNCMFVPMYENFQTDPKLLQNMNMKQRQNM